MLNLNEIRNADEASLPREAEALAGEHLTACMTKYGITKDAIERVQVAGGVSYEAEIEGVRRRLCVVRSDSVLKYDWILPEKG